MEDANETLGHHVAENPAARGMGSTMVSVVVVGQNMYWNSVGDSPLYHYRSGKMSKLNEDHSMAMFEAAALALSYYYINS